MCLNKNFYINIVFDCSFGTRFYSKQYDILEQVIITSRSIKHKWKFPHTLNLLYNTDVDEKTLEVLNSLGIELYKVEPEVQFLSYSLSRSLSYSIELRTPGTHRMVMDCDMIATNDLSDKLTDLLNYDICGMYEWNTNIDSTIQRDYDSLINFICKEFQLKQPYQKFVISENCWANNYHINEVNLDCPYFNPGVILMKECLVKEFAKIYKEMWLFTSNQNLKKVSSKTIRPLQVGMSVAMQHLSDKIGVFCPGINMLPHLICKSDKFKNLKKTHLLHCCSTGYMIMQKLCEYYLNDETNYLGDSYYYSEIMKHKKHSLKTIKSINRGYTKRLK